ncbi:hypothetical protein EST38_g12733 [Candolleomyces aberdarensis]|uniref:Uncharacterized protein n=1 Tax=Candolleomyces aberdarensis TaxID=2316362 RepID=A0A4Q2D2G5_9AGAR|nr:hypothetical protein EST38_g12733 [Candolleomyces aberdarensis]
MSSSLTDVTVIVEHNDPSIQYASGNWQMLTNSAMMTLQTGAVMTVKFTGTKLSWVGWTPSGYPTGTSEASYSVDSEPATTFQIRGLPSGSAALYNQHLFETPQLPLGEHTLTVTHRGPSAPLTLDHLLIQNGDIIYPGGGGGQNSGTSIDGPDAASAATGTAQNPDPTSSQTQPSAGPPIGAIVGGAIGGAAFVLFCVLGLIWCLRRRKREKITRVNLNTPGASTALPAPFSQVTPFQYSSLGNQSTYSMSGLSQVNLASAHPNPAGWAPTTPGEYQDVPSPSFSPRQVHRDQKIRPNRSQHIELSPFNSSNALSDTSSSSGPRSSHASNAHLVHHKDSGIRLTSSNTLPEPEIIDVPPSYTPS